MKNKLLSVLLIFLLLSLLYSSLRIPTILNASSARNVNAKAKVNFNPQETQEKKPQDDYMSRFLARNAKRLGLKIDLTLQKLMDQSTIKWAFRAEERFILQ